MFIIVKVSGLRTYAKLSLQVNIFIWLIFTCSNSEMVDNIMV